MTLSGETLNTIANLIVTFMPANPAPPKGAPGVPPRP
jgi:hypothetical protein